MSLWTFSDMEVSLVNRDVKDGLWRLAINGLDRSAGATEPSPGVRVEFVVSNRRHLREQLEHALRSIE